MYLFTVTETYMITRRGLVLWPGLEDKHVLVGAKIMLIRPDKTIIETKVKVITFQWPRDILVESHLTKKDVPIGTEVWLNIPDSHG